MWKRMWSCCAVLITVLLCLPTPLPAYAVCGTEPPLPSEGLWWPVSGSVSNPWSLDCRTDRGHRGMDIDVPAGTPVRASASGVILFSGYTPAEGGGATVSIEHAAGLRTTYLHLAEVTVIPGQQVAQGQILAQTNGTSLHFGLKITSPRELYFNPLDYLADIPAPEVPPVTQPPETEVVNPFVPAPTIPAPSIPEPSIPAVGNGETVGIPAPVEPSTIPLANDIDGILTETRPNMGTRPSMETRHANNTVTATLLPGENGNPAENPSGFQNTTDHVMAMFASQTKSSLKTSTTVPGMSTIKFALPADFNLETARTDRATDAPIKNRASANDGVPFSWRGALLAGVALVISAMGRIVGKMTSDGPLPGPA